MDARYADLERELCRIREVSAARIVVDGDGRPTEVHILATPDKHAKQVVRDIQSVAIAKFGLELDRRLISVVQLEDRAEVGAAGVEAAHGAGDRLAAMGIGGRRTARPRRTDDQRVVIEGIVTERAGLTCTTEVILEWAGERAKGRAEGTLTSSAGLRIVANATIDALQQLAVTGLAAAVDTTTLVRLGDRSIALVTVVLVRPPHEETLAGTAVVGAAGEDDAMARAVLDAVNRRVSRTT